MQLKVINSYLLGRTSRNIIFWLLITAVLHSAKGIFFPNYVALLGVMVVSYAIPGYIHNLWLIPQFLLRRRYVTYCVLFLLLLVLACIGSYYETHFVNNLIPDLNYMGNSKNVDMVSHAFPTMLMLTLLAFGKFMTDALQNQRKLEDLEKQKLHSELESLRSQIDPHFLFNALNTIYGMARRTDMQTADAVIKLSDILRHGLYECEGNEIGIDKEILFLRQYIEFARLRIHNKSSIKLNVNAEVHSQKIAPLLLIPFVENAIKYGIERNSGDCWVNIDLALAGEKLVFTCANSHSANQVAPDTLSRHNGIGLKNVKRRLELLYDKRHDLKIINAHDHYSIDLKLDLV